MERGALIAGRYELTELLGRGGMGEVWAGRDRNLHRNIAVKLLHRDDNASPELIQRFKREAVAAAQINHPNIVALYDRGTHGHLQFLVMEHVEGPSLAQYLHRQGPLSLDRALEITQEICAALVAAHEANVVHYDIKPSNIMLTANGSIKVVDFGIAGFTHTHTFTVAPTTALSPVGTAQYGAPEQFLDQRGDERSDLYALGSVLFTLLTGEPPFSDGTPLSVIRRKLDEEPRQVAELRPDVPAAVAQLLTDLLRRDPEDRPGTATAVQKRLTHLRTDVVERDIREVETEPVPPPAATRPFGTAPSETADTAHGANAGHSVALTRNRWGSATPVQPQPRVSEPEPTTAQKLQRAAAPQAAINVAAVLDGDFLHDTRSSSAPRRRRKTVGLLGVLVGVVVAVSTLFYLLHQTVPSEPHYQSGDKPSHGCNNAACNSEPWTWSLWTRGGPFEPVEFEPVETTFALDSDKRHLTGTLRSTGDSDDCEVTVKWSLKADTSTVAEGTLTDSQDSYKLVEDLNPQAKTLVFSAELTDATSPDCTADVEWENPHLS